MTQLNIFDLLKPKEPPCYNCKFAVKRGNFRLCMIGKPGYKKIGIWESCSDQKKRDEE